MPKYWVIAPYDSRSEVFDKVWSFDLKNSVIAIGWREVGNPSKLTERELKTKFSASLSNFDLKAIWRFYHEISVGDVVIARRGTKKIIGLGKVTRTAFYDEQKGKEMVTGLHQDFDPNVIGVSWDRKDIVFEDQVFTFQTLYEIREEKYMELVLGIKPPVKQYLEEDTPLPELAAKERSACLEKNIDHAAFEAQLVRLGFSPRQARNTLRLLARMCLRDPLFFAGRRRGTIKAAVAYSAYSYLRSNGNIRKPILNQRKIAWSISQSDPVDPESFRPLFQRIVSEFEDLFPELFGET